MTCLQRISASLLLMVSTALAAQTSDSTQSVLDTARNEHRVKALNELFRAEFNGDPVKAVGYAREALNYATEVGDQKGLAAAYNNLGVAYRTHGDMDKALGYYFNALHIYETLADLEGISSTMNNIANLYALTKGYDQSVRYLEESQKIFIELNDTVKIIGSLNNLGNLHSEMQMDEKALEYYTQAFNLSDQKGGRFADPLTNIGNLLFKRNQYDEALGYYKKALQIEQETNNQTGLLNVLTNLGVTYTRLKRSADATMHLDEALRLCQVNQAYSFLPAIYKAQAGNHANQNRWKEAFETQLRYDEARDLVFGEESTRTIAQMELRSSLEELERKYEALQQDDVIRKLEHRNRILSIIATVLGVVFTLGVLNYVFLARKKNMQRRAI